MNNEKKQGMNPVSAPQYAYPPMIYPQDDEINLLDIWRVLAKRKKLVIAVSLLITLVGSGYAILKPEVYAYSTAIQLGSFFVNGKQAAVDEAKSAVSKVKEAYLISVLNDFYRENPGHPKNIKIDVSAPKDSEILIISRKCPESEEAVSQQLINKISAKLVDGHGENIKAFRNTLSEQIANAKKRLELLENNEKELNKRIKGFDKTFKAAPIDNSGTTVLVMTTLSTQKHQISIEKLSLQSEIMEKESELSLIQDTRLLYPVTKSIEPVSIDKKLMILLAVFAGFILGISIALMWDYVEKMKSQLTAPN
jgi:uncharacterized protein involved in exopolysaccharide biosynthesis